MREDRHIAGCRQEEGAALVTALLLMVVMGMLSTALVFTVQNEMKTSTAYKYSEQAFYVANAGVQNAVQWYANSYTPHLPASDYDAAKLPVEFGAHAVLLAGETGSSSVYPDETVAAAYASEFSNRAVQADNNNHGLYALNATLRKYAPATFLDPTTFLTYPSAIERWQLVSTGYWGSVAHPLGIAQITATIENSGNALFDRALWGIDSVNLHGTVLIDSYDPSLGPYGGANVGDMGAIGSNGSVLLNGNVTIDGNAAFGPAGSFTSMGGALVTGDVVHLAEPRSFPSIPEFEVGTTNVNVGGHNTQTQGPGSYGRISVGAQATLILTGGVYYIDELNVIAGGSLIVNDAATLFVKTSCNVGGQGLVNATGDPSKLTIFYSGTDDLTLNGGPGFYGDVYAPNALVTLSGNTDFFGSFIGKEVTDSGTPNIHFDEGSLTKNLFQRKFRLITWSQNTY